MGQYSNVSIRKALNGNTSDDDCDSVFPVLPCAVFTNQDIYGDEFHRT